ncbi:MAG: tRNA lysidine(34) synthetase TilS [Acidimicrobiales bacterium]
MSGAVDITDLLSRSSFPPAGAQVDCAVSGGADSLALLVLAVEAGCDVVAIHVDHGIRPGSLAEADVVESAALRFGAKFRAEQVVVDPGPNLEERARNARYGVLPDGALLGHTAEDQAETMLLNLLRGAGPLGMAAMPCDARRPILKLRRFETTAVCESVGLRPVVDPSNADPKFRRNRVRHELLPLLDDIAERDVAGLLARQAPLFGEQAELLGELGSDLDASDCSALRTAHRAIARVAIRQWFRDQTDHPHQLDEAAVTRVLEVAHNHYRATEVMGAWRVARSGGRLSLRSIGDEDDS